jgi:hypothetical protein
VHFALALQARLFRKQRKRTRAAEYAKRIRLDVCRDLLITRKRLDPNGSLALALKQGNPVAERSARLSRLMNLCLFIELGGSKALSVPALQKDYDETLARLYTLVGANET